MMTLKPESVLNFWFKELSPEDWWKKSEALDSLIIEKFTEIHKQASAGELYHWRTNAENRLAEIIVLDQFSRNMFRGQAKAFAQDPMALVLAQECVALGLDQKLETTMRSFLYLPYMHSESLAIHKVAMKLYDQKGLEGNLKFEILHKNIIERFGRYPHRNVALGRVSTSEEIEFLKQPNSSF